MRISDCKQYCFILILIFIKILRYGGETDGNLGKLRYHKFLENSTSKKAHDPASLPPTEDAAKYHAFRVHLQVSQWKNLSTEVLDPTEWGWKCVGDNLRKIKCDAEPAPSELLKFVRCKCNPNKKNSCGGLTCTCKKHGLRCVTACGNCRGELCTNKEFEIDSSSYEEGDFQDKNIFDIFHTL